MTLQELIASGTSREWGAAFRTARGSKEPIRPIYYAYLESRCWEHKRLTVIQSSGGRCQDCRTAEATQVHHLTYDRCGDEKREDLVALCRVCHENRHPNRRTDIAPPAKSSRFERTREFYRRKNIESKFFRGVIDAETYQKSMRSQNEMPSEIVQLVANSMPRVDTSGLNCPDSEICWRPMNVGVMQKRLAERVKLIASPAPAGGTTA